MIIVLRQGAQISNRLVALAALSAFCIRNNIRVLVLSLSDYSGVFEASKSLHGISLLLLPVRLYRLFCRLLSNRFVWRILRWCPGLNYLTQARSWADLAPAALQRGIWIIDQSGDWCSQMPPVSDSEAPIIRQIFRYHPRFHTQASRVYAHASARSAIVVGVHARRGDYAGHRGGIWFYTENDYLAWIEQAVQQLRPSQQDPIHFVLCSNEPGFLQAVNSPVLSVSPLSEGPADQLLLSMCDVIIGPPSTFSVWAAFLSDAKLLHLFSREQTISPSQLRRSTLFYGWSPRLERALLKA